MYIYIYTDSKAEDMDGVLYKNTSVETRIVAGLFLFFFLSFDSTKPSLVGAEPPGGWIAFLYFCVCARRQKNACRINVKNIDLN